MMKERLEELVEKIDEEIRKTGTVTVGGVACFKNSLRKDNMYAGLCHGAVAKLKELAPDLDVTFISFEVGGESLWQRGRHAIAEVNSSEGTYHVDPTIRQYLPDAARVYGPGDRYPLKGSSIMINRPKP